MERPPLQREPDHDEHDRVDGLPAQGPQEQTVGCDVGDGFGTGNVIHEIGHAVGYFHEHQRPDRDQFVRINAGNIEAGKEHNFDKNCTDATDIGEYDEGSMMHYGPFAFAVDNTIQTITSLRGLDNLMGQRAAVGPTDAETIAELYGVNNDPPTAVIAPLAASYPEGSPINFDGSGSSDPDDAVITWAWTFGDGTCTVVSPPAACTQESPTHTYADNGSYAVTLTVSDGFLNDVANATATVVNVDPVVAAGAVTVTSCSPTGLPSRSSSVKCRVTVEPSVAFAFFSEPRRVTPPSAFACALTSSSVTVSASWASSRRSACC